MDQAMRRGGSGASGMRAGVLVSMVVALAVLWSCGDGRVADTAILEAALCSHLASDPDFEAQVKQALSVRLLESGDMQGALRVARGIRDYRRGVAIARLAVEAARRGELARAGELAREAERIGRGDFGWRRSRVLGVVFGAKKGLGDIGDWDAALLEIEPEDQEVARATSVRIAAARGDVAGAVNELEARPMTAWDAAARAEVFLAAAEEAVQQGDEVRATARAIEAVKAAVAATGMNGSGAVVRTAAALVPANGGSIQHVRSAVEDGAERARALSALAQWRAAELRRIASCWLALEERDRAAALLDDALAGIGKIEPLWRPGARAQVAAGWWDLGDTAKAAALWVEAAEEAAAHAHHRARAAGLIDVLGRMAEARCAIPPRIRELADETKARFAAEFPEGHRVADQVSGAPPAIGARANESRTRAQ